MVLAGTRLWGSVAALLLTTTLIATTLLYKEKAYIAEYKQEVAEQLIEAHKNARTLEQEMQAAIDNVAKRYEEKRREEREVEADTIADLRDGNLRLRNHWQGCEATSRVSADSITSSILDARAAAREASAGAIVRAGRQCDNWIIGLQEYAREVSE